MSYQLRMHGQVRDWLTGLRDTDPGLAREVGEAVLALLDAGGALGPPLAVPLESAVRRPEEPPLALAQAADSGDVVSPPPGMMLLLPGAPGGTRAGLLFVVQPQDTAVLLAYVTDPGRSLEDYQAAIRIALSRRPAKPAAPGTQALVGEVPPGPVPPGPVPPKPAGPARTGIAWTAPAPSGPAPSGRAGSKPAGRARSAPTGPALPASAAPAGPALPRPALPRPAASADAFTLYDAESFLDEFFPGAETEVEIAAGALAARSRAHTLGEARQRMGLTQAQVARRMNVRQERVSAIERAEPGAAEVRTLAAYVRALGGRLEIIAHIGDERITLR